MSISKRFFVFFENLIECSSGNFNFPENKKELIFFFLNFRNKKVVNCRESYFHTSEKIKLFPEFFFGHVTTGRTLKLRATVSKAFSRAFHKY